MFIDLEGLDGCGKTTQTDLVCKRLAEDGIDFKKIKLPDYESDSSILVRKYLAGDFGKNAGDVNAYATSVLYAADRFASYTEKWKKEYLDGTLIFADRYTPANAIYQNIDYIDMYNPDYVLILSGDHIYKMDYELMLDYHKENGAAVTIAAMPVPMEEASRFGIMITDDNNRIQEFEEKPEQPRSNLASMGIYIFSWPVLRQALIDKKEQPGCDFGKHIIPYCHDKQQRIFAYEYNGYWKDVGTISSLWEANMDLIGDDPILNPVDKDFKIYSKNNARAPQYLGPNSKITNSLVSEGCRIYGTVENSVLSGGVIVEEGAIVKDSVIMDDVHVKSGAKVFTSIIDADSVIEEGVTVGKDGAGKDSIAVIAHGSVVSVSKEI